MYVVWSVFMNRNASGSQTILEIGDKMTKLETIFETIKV